MERVDVAGVSMTSVGKVLDKSVRGLTREAGADARRDANGDAGMVDPSNCDEKLRECRAISTARAPKPAAAGGLNNEHVVHIHLHLTEVTEIFTGTRLALDPIFCSCARLAPGHAMGAIHSIVRQDRRGHRLEKTNTAVGAVATTKFAFATRADIDSVGVHAHRVAKFQHFRIRQP